MRVVCATNFYGSESPSGENIAFHSEVQLLREFGHEVLEFTTSSDALRAGGAVGKVRAGAGFIANPAARWNLRKLMAEFRPDVLHVHNVFPRLSPFILTAAANTKTATILSLHNFRLFCANGLAVRNGVSCTMCADRKSAFPALRWRCYRDSFIATLPVALSIAFHRRNGTFVNNVDAFVALTEFQKRLFVENKLLPSGRVHVRPNFLDKPVDMVPWEGRDESVVFIGRLSREKGVAVLIEAWRGWGMAAPTLTIVGDGPQANELRESATEEIAAGRIRFVGKLSREDAQSVLRRARLLVLPTLFFEGFPMIIPEAFSAGVPIVTSNLGELPRIVGDSNCGAVVPAGDARALRECLQSLWTNKMALQEMSREAVRVFGRRYTKDSAYRRIMEIYTSAITEKTSRSRRGVSI